MGPGAAAGEAARTPQVSELRRAASRPAPGLYPGLGIPDHPDKDRARKTQRAEGLNAALEELRQRTREFRIAFELQDLYTIIEARRGIALTKEDQSEPQSSCAVTEPCARSQPTSRASPR